MARTVVSYDKDLPEIPYRLAYEPPTSYLAKKKGAENEFEIIEGRRPSNLLLINKLRKAVDAWRASGYEGESSEVTRRLFNYWFDEDHLVKDKIFRYYFAQREAVETIIYLLEMAKTKDLLPLINEFGEVSYPSGTQRRLQGTDFNFHTSKGKRQITRYIPDTGEVTQDLPLENLRRYAFKMATGSGKTLVMAMMMVWCYFHKLKVKGSDLSRNFLIVAPNVIVYQRLEKDFRSNKIFHELPLIPPEWHNEWSNFKVICRGDSAEPDLYGNLFLTNREQIYISRESEWAAINPVDAILGKKPVKDLGSNGRTMLEKIKSLKDLVVMNDEAHHVHDEHIEWYKSLMVIQSTLPSGISLWMDFSATPKDPNGSYFPWIICDYPLAQAVEDRIVKAPLIVHRVKHEDPKKKITRENAIESYVDWLRAALARWKEHYDTYQSYGVKPVLFIMAENNGIADEIGKWLVEAQENGLRNDEVLIIHTDSEGDVTKKDLEKAREAARNIDELESQVKVIVSVLMLREGWDVRNVSVVLGLRPFSSKAKILPEQAIGRGLRLMHGIGPDQTQTLEVMGTPAFEQFVRELEIEGVGIKTVNEGPKPSVKIEPVDEKMAFDINIPLTMPRLTHNYRRISDLNPSMLEPILSQEELKKDIALEFLIKEFTTEKSIHKFKPDGPLVLPQAILSVITKKTMGNAKLVEGFAEIYPIAREYVANICFGQRINLEDEYVRLNLGNPKLQDLIARYLSRKIGELVAESRPLEFDRKDFKLSYVEPFSWRRNLPLLVCTKTIFNLVATYNPFEKSFAEFLEKCSDVLRFASLGTTEQESGTQFKVDYIKPSGAIGFYYPDWAAVQKTDDGEVNWIIETKGREYEGTEAKDASIKDWCNNVSSQTGMQWRYIRVNQIDFEKINVSRFEDLLEELEEHTRAHQ